VEVLCIRERGMRGERGKKRIIIQDPPFAATPRQKGSSHAGEHVEATNENLPTRT